MIPKSGGRFSEKIMLRSTSYDPINHGPVFALEHDLFRKSVTTLGSSSRAGVFAIML